MSVTLRVGLAFLALIELVLGLWTAFFPERFYNDVPTVDLTPPFSEHLFRDFGGATLGLAIVLGAAAIFLEFRLVVVALVAYLAFAVPHFVFHLEHLDHATTNEAVLLTGGNASVALIGLALAIWAVVRMTRDRHLHHPAVG